MLIVNQVASVVQTVIASISVHYGYGRHMGDISRRDLKQALFVRVTNYTIAKERLY